MRRFALLSVVATLATVAAMVSTTGSALGFRLRDYNVAFALLAVATVAAWPALRRRRVATLTMAYAGIVATLTGFAMLYTKDFPLKEWITWWHSVTSVAFLLVFLVHWLNNHPRLMEFARRLATRDRWPGLAGAIAWAGLFAFGIWTAAPAARVLFTRENYLHLSSWAIFLCVAFTYGLWSAYRIPRLRESLRKSDHRNRARSLVDISLFLACWLALLTGLALLYFSEPLRAGELKYVSKWWHTATSALFLAFVALHVGFNARLVAAHARRVDEDMAAHSR